MIDTILKLADALPSGRIDAKAFEKLYAEFGEFLSAIAEGDKAGSALELADVAYYSVKGIALAADLFSQAFGVTFTPDDALDLAIAKYNCRAQPGNPKDDAAEREAIKAWVGRN